MIILDTHIWVRWVQSSNELRQAQAEAIAEQEEDENGVIGICATSIWEVAKLVELGKLQLAADIADWFEYALGYPQVHIINLTPDIAIRSTQVVPNTRRRQSDDINDPSDQIIIATAIVQDCPLVTSDGKMIAYPDVRTIH